MNSSADLESNACIVAGVQPLLAELQDRVKLHFAGTGGSGRALLEQFIHRVFEQRYGATLNAYYPNLTAFTTGGRIRGVVGYRDGLEKPLFSEQYLDAPAELLLADRFDQIVGRGRLVEVGNLAFDGHGDARWLIAAMTVLLYAAGYRWVLFTAVKPLFNAFQRLGLRPVSMAVADPARLSDGGSRWGSYYRAEPVVCGGDIEAGYRKLTAHVSSRQPGLQALLRDAWRLGQRLRHGDAPTAESAV